MKLEKFRQSKYAPLLFTGFLLLVLPLALLLLKTAVKPKSKAATADYGPKIRVVNPDGNIYLNTPFTVSLILRGPVDAADLVLKYDNSKLAISTQPQTVSGLTLIKNTKSLNGANSQIVISYISVNNSPNTDLGNGQVVAFLNITPVALGTTNLFLSPRTAVADNGSNVTGTTIPPEGLVIGTYNVLNSPTSTPTGGPSPTLTATPTPTPPLSGYLKRINAGNTTANYTDTTGNVWLKDQAFASGGFGYVSGQIYSAPATQEIANTNDDPLYRTERYSLTAYRFTVPNGSYQVKLKFAELYCTASNCRKFNVNLEGVQVLANFDIFAASGGKFRAIDRTFTTSVSDGLLNIQFVNVTGAAKVNAIEVLQSGTTSPTPTTVPTATNTPTTVPTSSPTPTIGPSPTPQPTPTPTVSGPTNTPTPTPVSSVGRKINAGGPLYNDWTADKQYAAGSFGYIGSSATFSTTSNISGTTDPTLYKTERYGNDFTDPAKRLHYKFDVPNGNYQVVLKFAEIYSSACGLGKRLFHVKIQGTQVLTNFDIFQQAGSVCYKAVDKTFTTSVSGGILDIEFVPISGKNSPKVNAIKITKI